jgi:diguanylate cyclase (GGDEF)-like protein
MNNLHYIHSILPHIDDAFSEFYKAMLSDEKLSIFFENSEQIEKLVELQKTHFIASLEMPELTLQMSYVKLGEYHYDLRIPYVDFIKGSQMLEEYFLIHTTKSENSKEVMSDIFKYFSYMKSFTAKGYLNRMIQEDKKDIENFFIYSETHDTNSINHKAATAKLIWLRELLEVIETGKELDFEEMDTLLDSWLEELSGISLEKKEFIDDLEKRIMISTQNLFYFLQKKDYLEILPLYSSLLGIYKLTLLLNNMMTVEFANKAIESLKIDTLSQLLRKDSFLEFLKKEISYAKREEAYIFSVAYLDLDNFKHVNDNFGHYSGDKVIEKFGQIIKKSIRGSDIAFRIGGDEFAIIFKNATRQAAKKVCQKIKVEFSSNEFIFNENRVFNVGTSIGIAEYDRALVHNCEAMIKLVDAKLYDAKKAGKNQIAY